MVVLIVVSSDSINESAVSTHAKGVFGDDTVLIYNFTKQKSFIRYLSKLPGKVDVFVITNKIIAEKLVVPRIDSSPMKRVLEQGDFSHIALTMKQDALFGHLSIVVCYHDLDTFLHVNRINLPPHPKNTLILPTSSSSSSETPTNICSAVDIPVVFLTASWKSLSELYLFFVPENEGNQMSVCVVLHNPKIPVLLTRESADPIVGTRVIITGRLNEPRFPRLIPSNRYLVNRQRYEYNHAMVSDAQTIERVLAYLNIAIGDKFTIPAGAFLQQRNTLVMNCCSVPDWIQQGQRQVFGTIPEHIKTNFSLLEIRAENNTLYFQFYGRRHTEQCQRLRHRDEGNLQIFFAKTIESFNPDIVVCLSSFYELEDLLNGDLNALLSRMPPYLSSVAGRILYFPSDEHYNREDFMDYLCNVASFNGFAGNMIATHQNRHIEPSLQYIARRAPDIGVLLFLSVSTSAKVKTEGDAGGLNFSHVKNNEIYDNVYIVDYDSCYPSVIVTESVGPPMRIIDGDTVQVEQQNPLLAMYCKKLIEIRNRSKNSAYNSLYKLMSNICYGWFYKTFTEVGQAIAEKSRNALVRASAFYEMHEVTVLSGHTDSLFIQTNKDVYKLTEEFNQHLREHYGPDCIMHMSVKGHHKNLLQINLNTWAADDGKIHKGIVNKNMSPWMVKLLEEILVFRFSGISAEHIWERLEHRILEIGNYTVNNLPEEFFLHYTYEEPVKAKREEQYRICSLKNTDMVLSHRYKYVWVLDHSKGRLIFEPFTEQEKKFRVDIVRMIKDDLSSLLSQILCLNDSEIKSGLRSIFAKLHVVVFHNNSSISDSTLKFCIHCSSCYSQVRVVSREDLGALKNTPNDIMCTKCNSK